jgi:hypothetical protein
MAANSEFEDVSNLTIVLANYFIALSQIFPILESIEKEAMILADKVHNLLEQAAICQGVSFFKSLHWLSSLNAFVLSINKKV